MPISKVFVKYCRSGTEFEVKCKIGDFVFSFQIGKRVFTLVLHLLLSDKMYPG